MALTPTENEAFLREVDDNLRHDQMAGLARKWGRLVIVAIVILLLALGGLLWWRSHRAEQAGQEGEQLAQVLQDADVGRAGANDPRLAKLAASSRDGYRALARLAQAGLTANTDPSAAAANYQAIAKDDELPQAARDLAIVRATTLQFDALTPAEIVARMRPLATANGPWFGSAAELTALADLRLHRPDLAGPLFAAIARDPDAPAGLRGRAAGMATALGQTVAAITPAGALKE